MLGDGEAEERGGLLGNYPNPFNPETAIRYRLAEPGPVRLVIYNVLGQTVRTLVDGFQGRGVQQVVWDGRDEGGRDVASGNYIYRLELDGHGESGRMLLLR